ncbi:MAG: type II toxin-antitoxin system RelE/ParE family toxin [Bacteroidetes bacterium]|nr:MAG: type II toxin-antitoxin system RelE/ParE family toxin [Bacteroidota bacterium]
MPYQVILSRKAEKELAKLSTQAQIRIAEALIELQENPRPYGYKQLKGEDAFRVRVGDYRIIYEIQDDILLVYVVRIGHRKDAYD